MFPSPLSPSFIKSSICLPLQSACTTHFPVQPARSRALKRVLARAYTPEQTGGKKKERHLAHAEKKQLCFDTSKCRDAHTYIYFVSSCHTHTHTDVHVHTHTQMQRQCVGAQAGRQSSSVARCSSVRIKPVIREMKGKLSFHIGLYTHHPQ